MKKIIALAVAGAFVAPAFAADVSVNGEIEYVYTATDGSDDAITDSDNLVKVTATEEVNGFTLVGTFVILNDTSDTADTDGQLQNDGGSIAITAPQGVTFAIGDTTGALDAVGDYTDMAPAGGGFNFDGTDAAMTVTLPTFNGLTIAASSSPDTVSDLANGESGVGADMSAVSAKYNFGAGEVYYGQEEVGSTSIDAYGVKYSMSGLTVAYERGDLDTGTQSTSFTGSGFAASYTMGDIVVYAESQTKKAKSGTTGNVDETVFAIEYNLGSVDLYVSGENSSVSGTADVTYAGVEYNF